MSSQGHIIVWFRREYAVIQGSNATNLPSSKKVNLAEAYKDTLMRIQDTRLSNRLSVRNP